MFSINNIMWFSHFLYIKSRYQTHCLRNIYINDKLSPIQQYFAWGSHVCHNYHSIIKQCHYRDMSLVMRYEKAES